MRFPFVFGSIKTKGGVFLNAEIICALITLGGIIVSAVISYAISRTTANKEIEKMRLAWKREDVVSSDEEFSVMTRAVAKYVQGSSTRTQSTALEEVASVRAKEAGSLGQMLDDLYSHIRSDNVIAADHQLSKVIDQKREAKSKANTAS